MTSSTSAAVPRRLVSRRTARALVAVLAAALCVPLSLTHLGSAVAAAPGAPVLAASPQDPFTATGVAAPTVYGPRGGPAKVAVTFSEPGVFDVDWQVTDRTESTIWLLGTSTLDATASQTVNLELPYELFNGGLYYVRAWIKRSPASQGGYATQLRSSTSSGVPTFSVDESGPSTAQLLASSRDLYPVPDGFRDSSTFTLTGQTEPWYDVQLDIRNDDTNALVHTTELGDSTPRVGDAQPAGGDSMGLGSWDGRDQDGNVVPAGNYLATATVHDSFGNPSTQGLFLHVSSAHLVTRVWTKTVPAASSRIATTVGSCAALRSPATRHWAGSLTFNSGARAKCKTTSGAARVVSTTHKVTLPDAANLVFLWNEPNLFVPSPGQSVAVSVRAYGGAVATKNTRSSVASLRFLTAAGRSGPSRQLAARLGWQPTLAGAVSGSGSVIGPGPTTTPNGLGDGISGPDPGIGRTVRWTTTTSGRAAYDVKAYLVTYTYTALQN